MIVLGIQNVHLIDQDKVPCIVSRVFLKLSGIEHDEQKHTLLCKTRYPNGTVIPKDHEEDMNVRVLARRMMTREKR